jgi:AcrR family transcriptional regulator
VRTVDAERHRARRQQIVDAAAELFATKGFDATTTADICRAVGMSAGNVFHYFAGKREILLAVISDDVTDKASRLAAARAEADPWAALLDVVDLLIEPATNALGPPLVMEAMLQARRDPELAEWLARDGADERAVIENLVRRAVGAGRIDPGMPARDAASWINALIGAYYLQAATEERFRPAKQAANLRLAVERLLRPVG